MPITHTQRREYRRAVVAHARALLQKANVVAVGVGSQRRRGVDTSRPAVVVGVTKKVPAHTLTRRDRVPAIIKDGILPYRTDVIEVGDIRAQFDPTERCRPIRPGISVGHVNITAGTIGLIVRECGTGDRVLLSNNHILANANDSQIGDAILQPGPHDGGTSADRIGTLRAFVPITWDGAGDLPTCPWAKLLARGLNWLAQCWGRRHRFGTYTQAEPNIVDAAIATITVPSTLEIPEIGHVGDYVPAADLVVGQALQKYGRTTQYTRSLIQMLDATVRVSYGVGRTATFQDQIVAGAMSDGGDSGSSVHTTEQPPRVAGLLFAGSDQTTVLNPIESVFQKLNLSF